MKVVYVFNVSPNNISVSKNVSWLQIIFSREHMNTAWMSPYSSKIFKCMSKKYLFFIILLKPVPYFHVNFCLWCGQLEPYMSSFICKALMPIAMCLVRASAPYFTVLLHTLVHEWVMWYDIYILIQVRLNVSIIYDRILVKHYSRSQKSHLCHSFEVAYSSPGRTPHHMSPLYVFWISRSYKITIYSKRKRQHYRSIKV